MNRTGHQNCRKIDAQPLSSRDGTVPSHNSTQIKKPKRDNVSLNYFNNSTIVKIIFFIFLLFSASNDKVERCPYGPRPCPYS